MTVADDLATLRHRCPHMPGEPCDCPDKDAAADRVEAEIARLERHPDAWSQQAFDQQKARAEAAEAEIAQLTDALRLGSGNAKALRRRAEAAEAEVAHQRLLREDAEAEVARLRDGLRRITRAPWCGCQSCTCRRRARALLAEDGAA